MRVPIGIGRRDSESKGGGTLHHPIARKNGALGTPAPLRMTAGEVVRSCIPAHPRPAYTQDARSGRRSEAVGEDLLRLHCG